MLVLLMGMIYKKNASEMTSEGVTFLDDRFRNSIFIKRITSTIAVVVVLLMRGIY
jgi:hypothetical protein